MIDDVVDHPRGSRTTYDEDYPRVGLCAAVSCAEILADRGSAGEGEYYLDPSGSGAAKRYSCGMTIDGGGWTRVLNWDRENDGDTLSDFEVLMNERFNDMTDWSEAATYIQWSDYDSTADVMAYDLEIDVPNAGKVLLDVSFFGSS